MILRILIVLVALLTTSPATAQQQPTVPAPDRHEASGLIFPSRIGQADLTSSVDYASSMNRPDLGYSWNYAIQGLLSATVYVYRFGVEKIPSGANNAAVLAQFKHARRDIDALASQRYESLNVVRAEADCTVGGLAFRCMTLSGVQLRDRRLIETSLMVTGYRNNFVKLRIDWVPGAQADAAVSGFLADLASQMR